MSTNLRYNLTLKDLFSRRMDQAIGKTGRLDNKMAALGSRIRTTMGGLAVGFAIQNIVKTTAEMEGLEIGIKASAKSALEGERNIKFLNDQVSRLGLDLKGTAQGYQLFNASLIDTNLQGERGNEVFRQVSEAVAVMHLPAQQANATFLALGQMMSKGTVQAQELKLQLGNALPGAFQAAARAMGVTTTELNRMMEQGELISEDFLPKFGAEMERTFGDKVASATKSLQANLNRLNTEFTKLKVELGVEFMPLILSVTKGLISLAKWTKENIKEIKFWGGVILGVVVAVKTLTIAQTALNLAMSLNPISLVVIALGGLSVALVKVLHDYKSIEELHRTSLQESRTEGIESETSAVRSLAASYEKFGKSKSDAQKSAIKTSKGIVLADIRDLKAELSGATTQDQRDAIALRREGLAGRLQALTGGGIFAGGGGITSTAGSVAKKTANTKLGSGTESHGRRPQNLTVNITKLVETLKVEAATLKEGSVQIKEMVAKALLEAVNDINTVTK